METTPPDLLSLRASVLPTDWPDSQKALEMQVPDWLVKLVYRCLEKAPEARFRNGEELHHYISLHRIYTPEMVGLVKNEEGKWQSLLAEKNYELQDLRTIVAKQDKELQQKHEKSSLAATSSRYREPNTVSRSAFNALLIVLLLVGALAVYGLFFNRSVVGASTERTAGSGQLESVQTDEQQSGAVVSENSSAAKKEKKAEQKKKLTIPSVNRSETTVKDDGEVKRAAEDTPRADEASTGTNTPAADTGNEENENEKSNVSYKVRNKAFFHNEPDASTRRNAFIVHWNNAVLKPLNEKNGFVYVVFTNHLGQVSKGWLLKDDLVALK
jgi:serine/threonine-protein kinase